MSSLGPAIDGAKVLDLFAGSGSFSWEALSRGASHVVLVEQAKAAAKIIEKNRSEAERRFEAQSLVIPPVNLIVLPVKKALAAAAAQGPYDIVWADPPYREVEDYLEFFINELGSLMAEDAELVIESDRSVEAAVQHYSQQGRGWVLVKQRTYGHTMIHRLKYSHRS